MLAPINALADESPGFVWRLQGETGDATGIRAFGDDRILVNLSVWETIEALGVFVFTSRHTEVLRRRRDWFEQMAEAHLALWWIPAGATPTVEEAERRLATCANGVRPRTPSPCGSRSPRPARTSRCPRRIAGGTPPARNPREVPRVRPARGQRSALPDEALGPGPRTCGGAARSVRSPGAGRAGRSVRAAVRVLAFAAGRPDRVPGPTGRVPPARLLRQQERERILDVRDDARRRDHLPRPERHGRLLGPRGVPERRAGQARRHAHLLPGSGHPGRSRRDCRWLAATRRPNRPPRTRTCRGAAGRPRSCPPRTGTRRTTAGRGPSTVSSTGSSRRSTSRAAGTAPACARRTSRTRRAARARRGSGTSSPS